MEPSPLWWLLSPPPQDRSESCAGQDLIIGFGLARMAHCSASSAFGLQHPLPAWQPRAMHMLRNACRPSTAPPTRSQDSFHRRIAAQVGQRKRAYAHTIRQSSRRQTLAGVLYRRRRPCHDGWLRMPSHTEQRGLVQGKRLSWRRRMLRGQQRCSRLHPSGRVPCGSAATLWECKWPNRLSYGRIVRHRGVLSRLPVGRRLP